jgi:hypothetical protein
MFIHSVHFWLKHDLDDGAHRAFEQGLRSLCENPPVKSGYHGTPAASHRDVVDSSYDYAMILIFDDAAGQDVYQVGEVHQRFIADHSSKWERVLVYDTVVDEQVGAKV